jgi:hypothetical protein
MHHAHSASALWALPWISTLPNPSLVLFVALSEAKNPMHCASVEERPFRAASERLLQRGFNPRVLLTGPAEPHQQPVSFTLSS